MSGFWDRVAFLYDGTQTFNARVNREMIRQTALWVSPGSRVLDCAAGTGELALAAAEKAGSVLCTDLSPAMLDQAERKARARGLSNLAFARRDIFAPPPSQPFNVVIAGNVLHLLSQPQEAVRCLWACLGPGGRLILPTYLLGEISPLFVPVLRAYHLAGFRTAAEYTRESYLEMLDSCGVGVPRYKTLPGRIPVGFAVITKA